MARIAALIVFALVALAHAQEPIDGASTAVDASTSSVVDASTSSVVDASTSSVVDASTSSIVDASTSSIVDASTSSVVDSSTASQSTEGGSTAAPTTTTLKPSSTIEEAKQMCQAAHPNTTKVSVVVPIGSCQARCVRNNGGSFDFAIFQINWETIDIMSDKPIPLADGEKCAKSGMECFSGNCLKKKDLDACKDVPSLVSVRNDECRTVCTDKDGKTKEVNIKNSGSCGFFGRCNKGQCKGSIFRR